jgi:hypothetical protein
MGDDRKKRLETAKTEQFAALGEFIQDFEHVCFALRPIFIFCFHKNGLSSKGQQLAIIAINNHYLTAEPLVSIVSAVYCEAVKDDEVAVKVMRDVEKRFKKLIETRNRVVHGKWMIGWTSSAQEDFSKITGIYSKLTKKGLQFRDMPKSVDELKILSKEANELTNLTRLLMLPLIPTAPKIRSEDQFFNDGKIWRSKSGEKARS